MNGTLWSVYLKDSSQHALQITSVLVMNLAVLSSSGMQPSANDDFWGGTHPLPRDLVCKSITISKTAYQRKALFFPFISSIANGQGMFEKVFCIYMDGFACACHSCYEFHYVLYNCYPDASQCSQDLIAYTDGSVTKDEKNDPPWKKPRQGGISLLCKVCLPSVKLFLPIWSQAAAWQWKQSHML